MSAETVEPSVFREWMAPHVAAIRSLTSSVDAVLNAHRDPHADSVAMGEVAAEQNYKSRSAWESPITDTHAFAGAALRASSDYARGFAELFDSDHPPIYAHLPLARAALEAAGVNAWLSELGIAPLDRMKRRLCELLYSANEVSSLELSADSADSIELWQGVAKSFKWTVDNSRAKPIIDGTKRPRISESIVHLAGFGPGSRSGDLLFSRLSAADHVTWFGLSWAMDMASVKSDALSAIGTVPIGTSSAQVCAVAFYVVRALRTAASTHFTFMGWTSTDWQEATASAERLEAQLVEMAVQAE